MKLNASLQQTSMPPYFSPISSEYFPRSHVRMALVINRFWLNRYPTPEEDLQPNSLYFFVRIHCAAQSSKVVKFFFKQKPHKSNWG